MYRIYFLLIWIRLDVKKFCWRGAENPKFSFSDFYSILQPYVCKDIPGLKAIWYFIVIMLLKSGGKISGRNMVGHGDKSFNNKPLPPFFSRTFQKSFHKPQRNMETFLLWIWYKISFPNVFDNEDNTFNSRLTFFTRLPISSKFWFTCTVIWISCVSTNRILFALLTSLIV